MKISTSLAHFKLNVSTTNVQANIGSNWKNILNFWIFIDTLNNNQWNKIEKAFNLINLDCNLTELKHLAVDLNSYAYEIQFSTWACPYRKYNLYIVSPIYAVYELIAMDKILEEERTLQILPLFVNL